MGRSIIPLPGEGLQFIFIEDSGGSLVQIRASVATHNDLPITGNVENDLRITQDTDRMYTWSIASASGNLSDWQDIGQSISLDWSAITGGPTATPSEIDDAVAKKHEHSNKALLDTYDQSNANISAAIIHTSSDGTDHSDVVLNNNHRGSDGSDHSDVVANTNARGYVGTKDVDEAQIGDDKVPTFDVSSDKMIYKDRISIQGGITYFLHEEASDVATYQKMLPSPADDAENADSAIANSGSGEVLIKSFVTDPGTPNTLLLSDGVWSFQTYASVSADAGVSTIVIRLYKRTTGGVETELFNLTTGEINGSSATLYAKDSVQTDFSVDITDRVVIKYFAQSTSGSNKTITLFYEGMANYTHVHTPLVIEDVDNHIQNTDTGTTSPTFALDTEASGFDPVKIKNESGVLAARNDADTDYIVMRADNPVNDKDLVNKGWLSNLYALIVDVVKNSDNNMINAFRIAINGALTIFNMIDGIVDEYEDESGIDTAASINESYDAANDLYKPSGGVPISADPFAHYKCNDDAANTIVTDDGIGANNGVASTNTSNLSVVGKINDAFDFNGSTEYINTDTLVSNIKSDTTGSIAFWINPDSIGSTMVLFSLTDASSGNDYFYFRIQADGTLRITLVTDELSPAGSQWTLVSDTALTAGGGWYHIALVQDGVEPVLYVNGIAEGSFADEANKYAWFGNLNTTNIDTSRIGCWSFNSVGNDLFLDGQIDDFRYYNNFDLSSGDVSSIYNEGNGTEDQNPVGPVNNMTLISDISLAATAQPDNARIIILEEDVAPITLNTDIKVYVSRDGGSTWALITLEEEGNFDASSRILVGNADLDVSGIGAGTDMEYKIETLNSKMLKLHGTALRWD